MQAAAEVQSATETRSATPVADVLEKILQCLDTNKADDIVSIDLSGKSSMADYMVIANGGSQRQVAALTDYVMKELKALGVKETIIQGLEQADWVLMDAGDILVHIFRPEVRDFYNLDKMWLAEPTELVN